MSFQYAWPRPDFQGWPFLPKKWVLGDHFPLKISVRGPTFSGPKFRWQYTTVFGRLWSARASSSNGKNRWAMKKSKSNGGQQELRTPSPRWVSSQLLYIWVSAWRRSWRCSQNCCRPFLRAMRLFTLRHQLHYITWNNFFRTRSVISVTQ